MKAANSLVAVVYAEEDLLGERVRRQPVPAQVEICEERQVLKGPEIVPWFQASQDHRPNIRHAMYRESLKGSSQVEIKCGGKIAFSCLQKVNKTQLSHLISHNLGRAF